MPIITIIAAFVIIIVAVTIMMIVMPVFIIIIAVDDDHRAILIVVVVTIIIIGTMRRKEGGRVWNEAKKRAGPYVVCANALDRMKNEQKGGGGGYYHHWSHPFSSGSYHHCHVVIYSALPYQYTYYICARFCVITRRQNNFFFHHVSYGRPKYDKTRVCRPGSEKSQGCYLYTAPHQHVW
jgi:hypothetical protein